MMSYGQIETYMYPNEETLIPCIIQVSLLCILTYWEYLDKHGMKTVQLLYTQLYMFYFSYSVFSLLPDNLLKMAAYES